MRIAMLAIPSATVVGILRVAGHSLAGILAVSIYLMACVAVSAAGTAKSRLTEDRLNALVPRIPVPQSDPGQGAGGASTGGNSSFSMSGGTTISYNPGSSGNNGGSGSQTSGQIGGASAHVHDMTHYHTNSSDLQTVVNTLQGSYSTTVAQLNTLKDDHNQLVADHTTLRTTLKNTGVLH